MQIESTEVPCCYFPTRVLIIDDNAPLIESLCFHLTDENILHFKRSKEALDFLASYKQQVSEKQWLKTIYDHDLYDESFSQPVLIDISKIIEVQNNKDKYNDISVLILDYAMPEINGLDLLNEISDKPFKIILLTGEEDYAFAVSAFNEGKIDFFLRKDEEDLVGKLNSAIRSLKIRYFMEVSKSTIKLLSLGAPMYLDREMCSYYYHQIFKHRISEFYLINLYGNYLFIDELGRKKYFLAYTKKQLLYFYSFGLKDKVNESVLDELREARKIIFFGEGINQWEVASACWERLLLSPIEVDTTHGKFFTAVYP